MTDFVKEKVKDLNTSERVNDSPFFIKSKITKQYPFFIKSKITKQYHI